MQHPQFFYFDRQKLLVMLGFKNHGGTATIKFNQSNLINLKEKGMSKWDKPSKAVRFERFVRAHKFLVLVLIAVIIFLLLKW